MSALRAIVVICAIPALGLLAYWTILYDVIADADFFTPFKLTYLCALTASIDPKLVAACNELQVLNWVGIASLASITVGLAIPAVFWLAAGMVRSSRFLLASVFPPLTFVGIIIVAALFLVHAGILAGGAYYAESYWLGRVHFILIGLIGLIGVAVALIMTGQAFSMFRPTTISVIGAVASATDFPKLHGLIGHVADRISARRPDNLVLGLDGQFFATSAKVQVIGHERPLRGETLYISLPLLRVFSKDELSAVIGHELGHFYGRDTAYSLRFAPIYRGLSEAVALVDTDETGETNIIGLPAKAILQSMLLAFSRNEAQASRDRELAADELGAQASSPEDLAYALLKMTVFAHFWAEEEQAIVDRLQIGRVAKNISANFVEKVRYDLDRTKIGPALREMLYERISHPTDTHPPTGSRIEAFGLSVDKVLDQKNIEPRLSLRNAAIQLLDDVEPIEEQLTTLKHGIYAAMGVPVPDQQSDEDAVASLMAEIIAHLVRADGVVVDEEIHVAEDLAERTLASFDRAQFRECCRSTTELADLDELLRAANDVLTDAGKVTLLSLLHDVALADGEVPTTEKDILERAVAILKADE